jgi:hypothetical protein
MQPPFILVKIFSCCRPNYPLCTNSIFFVTRVYKRSLFAYLNVALLINLFISLRTPTPPLSSLYHLILRRRHISLNKRRKFFLITHPSHLSLPPLDIWVLFVSHQTSLERRRSVCGSRQSSRRPTKHPRTGTSNFAQLCNFI